jgi:hypothetical protein
MYQHLGGSWWWFAGLFLLPDLPMLVYLKNAQTGAFAYNMTHTYVWPLAGAAVEAALREGWPNVLWLVWLGHIAMDRMVGYGLKFETAFHHTHLGNLKGGELKA